MIGSVATPSAFILPNYGLIHQELRRKGMTLMLLWEEHVEQHGQEQTHRYAQFCLHYRDFQAKEICKHLPTVWAYFCQERSEGDGLLG